jgi:hypothetical protein
MRHLSQLRAELFDEPRLAEPGLAHDEHELAFASLYALPAAREHAQRPLLCSVAALGLLMNRAPLYARPETVVPADFVARAYEAFQRFDWAGPELTECCCLAGSFMSTEDEAVLTWAQSLERRIPYAVAGRRPLGIAADDRSWRNCRVPQLKMFPDRLYGPGLGSTIAPSRSRADTASE